MKTACLSIAIAVAGVLSGCSPKAPDTAAPAASAESEWSNPYPRAEMPGHATDTAQERANLQLAVQYFDAVNNARDVEAAKRMSTPDIALHDPERENGQAALASLIEALATQHPQSRSEIKRIVTDGEHVFVHAHTVHTPGTVGFISGNLYRIADGKVADQRIILHPIPEKPHADNPNNAFCAGSSLDCPSSANVTKEQEASNKQRAIEFYNAALNEKDWKKSLTYMGDRYTQHSLYMQDGPSGLEDLTNRLIRDHPQNLGEMKVVLADGDLVVMHLHVTRHRGHPGWSVFEIIRMEDGKAVEHWDMFRTVPENGGEKLF
jgi:predicted SnoaL-like aldol condensation-catalyzing enzyme